MKRDPLISIGYLAKRTGLAVSAVRFYESKGLIPSLRSATGQRQFSRSVIRRVSFIMIAQQLGYSLSEIKSALALLPEQRTPTKSDWDSLAKSFSRDLDEKIRKLQQLQDSLSSCIGCGCLSLKSCKLYNPDDSISRRGTGARFLQEDSPDDIVS